MTRSHQERGAAAVEFALLLPLLMMLLLGIMEFGYAFLVQASVAGAARVGARDYAIHYAEADAEANAIAGAEDAATSAFKDLMIVSATFLEKCDPADPDSKSTFELKYQYTSLTGLFDGLLGSDVSITGKGSMQCGG